MKLLHFLLITFFCFSLSAQDIPSPKQQMLKAFGENTDPNMAKIFETFLSNFEEHNITSWSFSETTGDFTICLEEPLKLWIPPRPKPEESEPKPGSILIFGMNNKVSGKLEPKKKNIAFKDGFFIYCKYKIGFVTLPITAQVYNFSYSDDEHIFIEAGKSGVTQKRSKGLADFLRSWSNPANIVLGDHELYLENRSKQL